MKTKRISTLILAMIMLLSTLTALPVSAATPSVTETHDIEIDANDVDADSAENADIGEGSIIFKNDSSASYTFPVTTAGDYKVGVLSICEPSYGWEFNITATIGEWSRTLTRDAGGYEYRWIGGLELEESEAITLKLDVNGDNPDAKIEIVQVCLKYMPGTEVSPTEDTIIPARDYVDGKWSQEWAYSTPEDMPEWPNGDVVATAGDKYGVYKVNVSTPGYYSLSSLTGCQQTYFNVYLDGEQVMTEKYAGLEPYNGNVNGVYTQLGIMYLSEGTHYIKLEVGPVVTYLFGFKLSPYTKTIDREEKTTVQFYKDFVSGTYKPENSAQNTPYYHSIAETGSVNNKEDGYLIIQSGHALKYVVTAEEAGVYKVSMTIGGTGNSGFNITVNDETVSDLVWVPYEGDDVDKLVHAHEAPLGNIYLNKGINEITFTANYASIYAYSWSLERVYTTLPENGGTIGTVDALDRYNADEGDIFKTSEPPLVAARAGYWFEYTIYVEEAGNYSLDTKALFSPATGTLTNLTTGEEYYKEQCLLKQELKDDIQDYDHANNYRVGAIYLDEGVNTLRFDFTSGGTFFYNFTLLPLETPLVELYNIDADENVSKVTEILDGTMQAKVHLPDKHDDQSVAVIFAIYEDGNLYALNFSNEAKAAGEARTLTIGNVAKEFGPVYTYKVFYWEDMESISPLY